MLSVLQSETCSGHLIHLLFVEFKRFVCVCVCVCVCVLGRGGECSFQQRTCICNSFSQYDSWEKGIISFVKNAPYQSAWNITVETL